MFRLMRLEARLLIITFVFLTIDAGNITLISLVLGFLIRGSDFRPSTSTMNTHLPHYSPTQDVVQNVTQASGNNLKNTTQNAVGTVFVVVETVSLTTQAPQLV